MHEHEAAESLLLRCAVCIFAVLRLCDLQSSAYTFHFDAFCRGRKSKEQEEAGKVGVHELTFVKEALIPHAAGASSRAAGSKTTAGRGTTNFCPAVLDIPMKIQ